jgi:hypothetical protein
VVQEDRLLRRGEMRGELGDLGEEGVGHEDGGLVLVARGRVAKQGGDVDLEGAREAIERGQGRHGLAVLDLGDVGARDVHARGELPLREIADAAEITDGRGDLDAFGAGSIGLGDDGDGLNFGQIREQRLPALAADVVSGAELYELAVLATKDLAFSNCDDLRLGRGDGDRSHSSCHVVVLRAVARAGTAARHV